MTLDEAIKNATEGGAPLDEVMVCILKQAVNGAFLIMENPVTKKRTLFLMYFENRKPIFVSMDDFQEDIKTIEIDYNNLPD